MLFGGGERSVSEVENEVLELVANVFILEVEEEGEQVQEIHVRGPLVVRQHAEVANGSECGGNGSVLRESEQWVLSLSLSLSNLSFSLSLSHCCCCCRPRRTLPSSLKIRSLGL